MRKIKVKFPKIKKERKRRGRNFEFFRPSDILDKRDMWTASGMRKKKRIGYK